MNVLDLFSGIGGFSLGLERAGMRTVAFCEIEPYCRAVLRKHWPGVPCFDDIRAIDADRLGGLGPIDLVCGGFPCQPFSVAGKQRAHADDRHLWPEMRRVIALARPAWVVGENVAGLIPLALDEVLADLEALGYACRPFVIPACAVDAPHRRDRVWIIGKRIARDRDRDRCAACFAILAPAPLGGRYACTCWPPNSFRHLRGSYWSEALPEGAPVSGVALFSRHGRPPLYFYGHKP